MSRPPKIPKEQRSFGAEGVQDRRDPETGAQSGQPGDADVNLDEQGRFGNLKQNLTTHLRVEER